MKNGIISVNNVISSEMLKRVSGGTNHVDYPPPLPSVYHPWFFGNQGGNEIDYLSRITPTTSPIEPNPTIIVGITVTQNGSTSFFDGRGI